MTIASPNLSVVLKTKIPPPNQICLRCLSLSPCKAQSAGLTTRLWVLRPSSGAWFKHLTSDPRSGSRVGIGMSTTATNLLTSDPRSEYQHLRSQYTRNNCTAVHPRATTNGIIHAHNATTNKTRTTTAATRSKRRIIKSASPVVAIPSPPPRIVGSRRCCCRS